MNPLRDLYLHEHLQRYDDRRRHSRSRAPGDEGPRRPFAPVAALLGRVLVRLGAGLLQYSGARTRSVTDFVPLTPPRSFSQN